MIREYRRRPRPELLGWTGLAVVSFAIGFAGYSLWTLAGWIARVVAAFLA